MPGTPTDDPQSNSTFLVANPCVAVSFTDRSTSDDVEAAGTAGMDVAELRIDLFDDVSVDHVVAFADRFTGTPTIATIRSTSEGGRWSGTDADRLALFDALISHVDAFDIELSSSTISQAVVDAAHAAGRAVIVSFHDFDHTPPRDALDEVIGDARALGADLVKIAVMVRADDDLRRLASVLTDRVGGELIVIGMGKLGAPSRLLFPFIGSRLTFAAIDEPSAPGQLPLTEMAETLRSLSSSYAARHPAS